MGSAQDHDPPRELRRFWAYGAAFGALWGALEITLGAFLHALHLPFAGVAMATVGAMFLVAQRQVVPVRGLTLATGAVAALCKSVSPGGIILGPMVGIAIEALVVELALLPDSRSRASAILGVSLAATWALSQQVVTHVVVYGTDVLDLYTRLLDLGADLVGLPSTAPLLALAALVIPVTVLGLVGGLVGHHVGLRAAAGLRVEQVSP